MIKINLVPQEILAKEAQRQQVVQAVLIAGTVLALVAGLSVLRWHRVTRLEAVLVQRQAEYDTLAKIIAQVEELERTAAAVRIRLGVIMDLLKGRALYPYFMTDLSETMPPDVWVASVGTAEGKQPGMLAVSLAAQSLSSRGVSAWLRNLEQSGKFNEIVLSAIAISATETERTHHFSIKTDYRNPKF